MAGTDQRVASEATAADGNAANVTEGRPDVPGGGQKGVISMYPLRGGGGVVEVEPDWTLCPPWVNDNVAVN